MHRLTERAMRTTGHEQYEAGERERDQCRCAEDTGTSAPVFVPCVLSRSCRRVGPRWQTVTRLDMKHRESDRQVEAALADAQQPEPSPPPSVYSPLG